MKEAKEPRGLFATIDCHGKISVQPVGQINNAEFLGIGLHIISTPIRDGLSAALHNQLVTGESLKRMAETLLEMSGEELCSKDLSSEQSPSSDSGPSTENSQVSLEE